MTSSADTVFLGGTIFHGPCSPPRRGAVAVTAGRISALDQAAIDSIGDDTRVIDIGTGLLLPGFVDAHVHPIEGGLERMRCDLSAQRTAAEYLDAITAYAASHPDLPWIIGGGWQQSAFPGGTPLASDLDRIVPDRPVFLQNRDHHGAWVNTAALRIAGIDGSTPDPADGRIERARDGSPSGTLHEGARGLVAHLVPADTSADTATALRTAQAYLHSVGVTGWQDAIVGEADNHSDTTDAYLDAVADGSLVGHVVGALWWERDRGLEQIDELIDRRDRIAGRMEAIDAAGGGAGTGTAGSFTASTVKIMQDGIPENRTAAMIDPYLMVPDSADPQPASPASPPAPHPVESGISFLPPALLDEAVTRLDAAGFQVHIHAIGDRAVRESLDAFDVAVAANGRTDNRHHIAHVQIVHPDDVPRFAALGVTMNAQALWATWEPQMVELNLPLLGEERASWQYPFGDAIRAGAMLCAGSDWPVTTPDPWAAIHVAVNRTLPTDDPDHNPRPLNPAQSITLTEAIAAYTAGSNRVNHRDDAGTIRVGAVADLVLTDRNPFDGQAADIHRTRTLGTWVGGRRVFTAESGSSALRQAQGPGTSESGLVALRQAQGPGWPNLRHAQGPGVPAPEPSILRQAQTPGVPVPEPHHPVAEPVEALSTVQPIEQGTTS
ncbi:amidohydrolase [Plantibacter sp. Mn2098]|uniref:amidohydrolase n=1 Tax=Plantibacter sp. Mn2098 TaxID=3395266 RepID=UPI003BC1DFE9